MSPSIQQPVLNGAKALVVGVANDSSIAYGCAKAFRELGADLALTYLNEKARPHVEPLARELNAPLFLPLDVSAEGQLEAVFDAIGRQWASSTSWCTRSPSHRRKTCRAGCSLLGRRVREGDGCFVPLVRAHGKAGRAADEERRTMMAMSYHGASRSCHLQRDGSGEGGAGILLPLPGL